MAIPLSVPSLSLDGKVAIITGGGTGMGRVMAVEFARFGADVVVASRTLANLHQVAAEVRALGRRALAVQTDVSEKAEVDTMVATTMEAFGQIDILVNNAGLGSGIGADGRGLGHSDPPWLIDIPEDNWDPIIAVNLKGVYLCCAAVGRVMVEQKHGNIINISSRAGASGAARPYSAAKAGVNRLTGGLARELGPYNIRVNGIAPAYTRTEVGVMQRPSEVAAYDTPETLARHPLGRIAESIDIACAALFFASEASNGITGQVLDVDCGVSA
ncbi:MAG: SDR family NAD(P)-dependent oxidoreductase [Candidatus Tectomicrobia bacterium]